MSETTGAERLKRAMLGFHTAEGKETIRQELNQTFDSTLKRLKADCGQRALKGLFCGGDDV